MTRQSSVWPLDVSIADAVSDDAALAAILTTWDGAAGIFSTEAPRDAGFPRIVLTDATEGRSSNFRRKGNTALVMLDIWSNVVGRQQVLEIYGHLVRLLEGQQLSVEGHEVYDGSVRLVSILRDPAEPLMHGVVEFICETRMTE